MTGLLALAAVAAVVLAWAPWNALDVALDASPPPAESTSPAPRTVPTSNSAGPEAAGPAQQLVVRFMPGESSVGQVPGTGIQIKVMAVSSLTSGDGQQASGGRNGPGGGGVSVGGDTNAGSGIVMAVVDFVAITDTMTCVANGIRMGDSVIAVDIAGAWVRMVVLNAGHFGRDGGALPVTFQVSHGQGAVPESDRTCISS
ncbi:MAG: hypothetical protein M3443_17255 [Actinomycetota bacterium]|nr:hypothetical protein [Actinomycetota bacterium]